jgi:type IV pilus assembly protein PilC
MKAGIPLLKALQIVSLQVPEGKFKEAIGVVLQEIQEGKNFSEALSGAPRYFSLFFTNMIKAAEVSGNLVGILKELSQYLTQQRRIIRQVQAAVMYPLFVLVIAVVILTVLFMFVVPVFVRIFEDLGGALPSTTLFLINMSKFLVHWGWLMLLVVVLICVGGVILYRKSYSVKLVVNASVWRMPLFGNIVRTMEIGRFCRTLGALLSGGITLTKGLDVLLETTPSVLLHRALDEIRQAVEQGRSLSEAMEETKVFPLTLCKMIQVGEESGKIAELFSDAADDYEEETSFAITGLLSLLEPLLIVVMGAIVGFIVVSLFFPIFTISGLVK